MVASLVAQGTIPIQLTGGGGGGGGGKGTGPGQKEGTVPIKGGRTVQERRTVVLGKVPALPATVVLPMTTMIRTINSKTLFSVFIQVLPMLSWTY